MSSRGKERDDDDDDGLLPRDKYMSKGVHGISQHTDQRKAEKVREDTKYLSDGKKGMGSGIGN